MVDNFRKRRNVILGDEMGLGKTAQSVAVIEHVRTAEGGPAARRPALIVAPLTTLPHWKRECERWTDLNVVVYNGGQEDRALCEQHEFRRVDGRQTFDVVITTYETVRDAGASLRWVEWGVVVADEAHKLKNPTASTGQAGLALSPLGLKTRALRLKGAPAPRRALTRGAACCRRSPRPLPLHPRPSRLLPARRAAPAPGAAGAVVRLAAAADRHAGAERRAGAVGCAPRPAPRRRSTAPLTSAVSR